MATTTGAAVRAPSSPPPNADTGTPKAALPPPLPVCTATTPTASSSSRRGISVGEFVDASFASFERTYGGYSLDGKIEEEQQVAAEDDHAHDEHDDDDSFHSSFWSALSTVYLPILFLWLRRSMFGTAHLLRSLLLGHVVRLLFTYISPPSWMTTKSHDSSSSWWDSLYHNPWIQSLLYPKADPHAWPPPALTALAMLTIFAFVVHPDGLTWIVLGKLRDGIMSLLRSLTTVFRMVKEHGILATFAASATLAALTFLAGILYKTLSPRTNPHHTSRHPSTKKKKRKGHNRGRAGRIRGGNHQQQQNRTTASRPPQQPQRERHLDLPTVNLSVPEPDKAAMSTPPRPRAKTVDAISATAPRLPTTTLETAPARARTSTVDTIPLADDQSCDSMSTRSISSAPTRTATSTVQSGKVSNTTNTEPGVGKGKQSSRNKRKQQGKHNNKKSPSLDQPEHTSNSGKSTGRFSNLGSSSPKSTSSTQAPRTPVPSSSFASGRISTTKQGSKRSDGRRGNHRKGRGSATTTASNSPFLDRPGTVDSSTNDSSFFSSTTPMSPPFSPTSSDRSVPRQRPTGSGLLAPISPPLSHTSLFSNGVAFGGGQNNNTASNLQSPPRRSMGPFILAPDSAMSGGSVRYSVPNYAGSYSQGDSRYTPGKMELAAFLAQVGLMGTACADLLADLADVDALALLTDTDFAKYKIVPAKRAQISLLMEARRRKQESEERNSSKLSQWSSPTATGSSNNTVVRPPPGLGGPAVVTSGSVKSNTTELNFGKPMEGLPLMPASASGSSTTNGPPMYPSLKPHNTTLPSSASPAESRLVAHFGKEKPSAFDGKNQTETRVPPHPFVKSSYGPAMDAHGAAMNEDDENSQIEAELQELGGQMIGSILDF